MTQPLSKPAAGVVGLVTPGEVTVPAGTEATPLVMTAPALNPAAAAATPLAPVAAAAAAAVVTMEVQPAKATARELPDAGKAALQQDATAAGGQQQLLQQLVAGGAIVEADRMAAVAAAADGPSTAPKAGGSRGKTAGDVAGAEAVGLGDVVTDTADGAAQRTAPVPALQVAAGSAGQAEAAVGQGADGGVGRGVDGGVEAGGVAHGSPQRLTSLYHDNPAYRSTTTSPGSALSSAR